VEVKDAVEWNAPIFCSKMSNNADCYWCYAGRISIHLQVNGQTDSRPAFLAFFVQKVISGRTDFT